MSLKVRTIMFQKINAAILYIKFGNLMHKYYSDASMILSLILIGKFNTANSMLLLKFIILSKIRKILKIGINTLIMNLENFSINKYVIFEISFAVNRKTSHKNFALRMMKPLETYVQYLTF